MTAQNILKKLNSRDTKLFPSVNTLTKIVFIALIAFTTIFLVKNVLAETSPETVSGFQSKQNAMEKGNNQESWMKESAGSNAMVGINILAGTIPSDVLEGKNTSWIPGGMIGLTNKSIASLYKSPISGVEYLASIKNNFLGKPVYAASGYEGLSSLLPLWKGFRNATYTIFSLVFIIMGIMIMLRVKISPQAVITIQSSIPKLITALILVTFSYAIVGLLIDFSYVVEAIGISLILNASGSSESISGIITNPGIYGRLLGLVPAVGIIAISGIIAVMVAAFSGGALALASVIGFIVIVLALFIMIFVYLIKFTFGLLKCYINIIIKTIIGPLEIALGAIPNMKMGFGSWFTDIIANILVFPISLIFLVMIKAIMEAIYASSNLWAPSGLELLSTGWLLSVAVGLGGLMLVSKLPKLIPEFIFQIKPSPWGKAIGEGFAPIGGLFSKSAKGAARGGINKVGGQWETDGWDSGTSSWRAGTRGLKGRIGKAAGYFSKK